MIRHEWQNEPTGTEKTIAHGCHHAEEWVQTERKGGSNGPAPVANALAFLGLLFCLWSPPAFACTPPDMSKGLQRALTSLGDANYEAAMIEIEQIEQNLTCLNEFVNPEELGKIFETGAIAAHSGGVASQANTWWVRRCVTGENVPLTEFLPIEIQNIFTETCRTQTERGSIQSSIQLRVDGWEVFPKQPWLLLEGDHLIQYQDQNGHLVSEWMTVYSGRVVHVGPEVHVKVPLRTPLLIIGSTLIAAGTASILGSGLILDDGFRNPEDLPATLREVNGLRIGGSVVIGVGLTSLLAGSLLSQ